jgi:hypothetical protein
MDMTIISGEQGDVNNFPVLVHASCIYCRAFAGDSSRADTWIRPYKFNYRDEPASQENKQDLIFSPG